MREKSEGTLAKKRGEMATGGEGGEREGRVGRGEVRRVLEREESLGLLEVSFFGNPPNGHTGSYRYRSVCLYLQIDSSTLKLTVWGKLVFPSRG